MSEFDYIVIGSGIAGLYTALLASQNNHSVLLLTKGELKDCNSQHAQGGIAAAVGPGDSPAFHLEDTLVAGAGLCDQEAAAILTSEGPQIIADLVRLGVRFDTDQGQIALGREGAHGKSRILHADGDATGAHIESVLSGLVQSSQVEIREHAAALRLIPPKTAGHLTGVEVAMLQEQGRIAQYAARYVVLATGGTGRLFRHTTNPQVATGDGIAIAFRAGAAVTDMEFCQFHPTALKLPGAPAFLISEAVRGEGAVLRTAQGDHFMTRYHPMADLAPRDVVSRAIVTEMKNSECDYVLLDATELPAQLLMTRFPTIYHTCRQNGLDITQDPIPVAPAAHYMMGGILTNSWGETTIPGLYACGEVACNGLHGANRLASNSLLEALVFAKRVVQRTDSGTWKGAKDTQALSISSVAEPSNEPLPDSDTLVHLMWDRVGIVRNGEKLRSAVDQFERWTTAIPHTNTLELHSLANRILVGRLMAYAALNRTESRGAHFRSDFPRTRTNWERRIVMKLSDPGLQALEPWPMAGVG